MDEEKKEARRKALAELEGSWDTVEPPVVPTSGAPPASAVSPEVQAALDAAADRLVDSLNPPPVSAASLDDLQADSLDGGWGDDEEDEDDEPEESEPELPDEKLDPVAYAAAKKAQDERATARRERKRVKAESKKARRKARMDASRAKQKAKTKKPRSASASQMNRAAKEAKAEALGKQALSKSRPKPTVVRARAAAAEDATDDAEPMELAPVARAKLPPSKLIVAKKPLLSGTNAWMLGIALVVVLAAAVFVAVIAR